MKNIIEIRSYQLKSGTGSQFHLLLHERSLPLLAAAGIYVVLATAPVQTQDAYMLIRAYESLSYCSSVSRHFMPVQHGKTGRGPPLLNSNMMHFRLASKQSDAS